MKITLLLLLLLSTLFATDIQYFEDKNSSLTAKTILEIEEFLPYTKVNSNFGMTHSTFWLKLSLTNTSDKFVEKIMNFSYPLLDVVTLYKLEQNRLVESAKIGNLVVKKDTSTIEPNLSLYLMLEAQQESVYYVKVKSDVPMNLDMNFYTADEFSNYKYIWLSSITFYIGAVLIIVLYNLILYLIIRMRAYLYYVMFHTSFLLLILALNGFFVEFIYPKTPEVSIFLIPFMIVVTASLQLLFVYEFLEIKKYGKVSKKVMITSIIYALSILIIIQFTPYHEAILLANTVSLIGLVIPLSIATYFWVKLKSISSKYYTIAWFLVSIGILIEHLKNNGLIETNFFTINAMQMGVIVEVLLISLALAYRFNQLQDQNLELTDLVATDSLTKIKNRRYFFEHTSRLLASLKRKSENYALLMLDIDHFKAINDTYGHATGDKILVVFTQEISDLLRAEDLFARIGGEEFILLVRSNKTEVNIFSKRVRESIESLSIECETGEITLTVSMGITLFSDGNKEVDKLLQEADKALYSAKENGRNRVDFFTKED